MVQLSTLVLAFVATGSALAAPSRLHKKGIAQDISDSTKDWEAACDAAGGGEQCTPTAVSAFGTLIAAAGPCDQQDNADVMVDLAKQLNNDANMIKFAQIFAQQPRDTPDLLSVPYCQSAPKNGELAGLFQCQFQGANPTQFFGGVAVGAAGTIPFGMSSPLAPAGSCPAHPAGPIPDGTQLVDQVSGSGVGRRWAGSDSSAPSATSTTSFAVASSASDSGTTTAAPASASATSYDASSAAYSSYSAGLNFTTLFPPVPPSTPNQGFFECLDDVIPGCSPDTPTSVTSTAAPVTTSATGSPDFHLQNGLDAQALNKMFASLSADAPCQDDAQACIGGAFAECTGGAFVTTPCTAGTTCVALPLVNTAGTNVMCDTQEDALARIAATGAPGGLTGN
ncbi:hypothetical protein FA95DRAFT_1680305 [Auriscalpium vulgare]|uniref:Uncharacterized protein n=1 Tax=Auriscalpium vulgare TaxID=40419 RepID=A0ACB8RNF8_9AGAM|nr:hypothetical protein FA95DRAFT_1680305 [Auriscalpium vulgare]